MESCTLCEHWSAHKALRLGLLTKVVPALKVDGAFVPNPLVVTDRWIDGRADRATASSRPGPSPRRRRRSCWRAGEVDLSLLDARGRRARLVSSRNTMPGCLAKTIESVRKHKLEHWDRNKESNRAWLAST